ncbi:type IV secretion system protein [Pinirhizobacter sp.]|jgi:type IV secretion system protein VirB6|uniref:type IV secretion system protein n=1 Tax=Pinirhizobacter sp. TaxID=2950432 RepID=UPI002F418808
MAGVAEALLTDIQTLMLDQAFVLSGAVMTVIQPIVQALLVVYVLLWGVTVASGRSQEPFGDGARRVLRIIFIVLLGFTADGYNSEVCEILFNLPSTVAAGMIGDGGDTKGIAQVLDKTMGEGMDIALGFMRDFSIWSIGQGIRNIAIGATLALLTIILVGIAIAFIYIAYVAMGILLAIGPFFIMLLIFEQTRRFFDGWLGQMVTFGVLFLLVAATAIICFEVLEQFTRDGHGANVGQVLKIMVSFLCMIAVMVQTRTIASSIGGGVAMQTQSAVGRVMNVATGGVRGAAGRAASAVSGAGRIAGGASSLARGGTPVANRARQTFK